MNRQSGSSARASSAWPRLAVAAAAALGLSAITVATAIVNFSIRGELPHIPFSGVIGPARMAELRFAHMMARGDVSPQLARQARAAAAGAPLAYEPYLFSGSAGFRDKNSGGSVRDAVLVAEAARRNPRSRAAHYMLMRHAVATGRTGDAFRQIAVLSTLGQRGAERLLLGVGRAVSSEAQVDEAVGALLPYPKLLDGFIRGFASAPKHASVVLHLAAKLPQGGFDRPAAASVLALSLLNGGHYAEARAVWQQMSGQRATGLIVDPDFRQSDLLPPFGWSLTQSEVGVAERQSNNTLFVDYYGRRPGPLAIQLLTLAPGRYRATIDYESESAADRAISFSLACKGGDRPLAEMALPKTRGRSKPSLDVIVPAGCGGQTLALTGLLTDHRSAQQVIVYRVDVRPAL